MGKDCDKLTTRREFIKELEAMSVTISKIATEEAQAKRTFEDIENQIAAQLRKVAAHKYNISQAQKELRRHQEQLITITESLLT